MGGAHAVLTKARESFEKGEYRWVAQVLNHIVFADPGHQEARLLEADALEQLAYQAESAVWRNFYLMGATELRQGVTKVSTTPAARHPDILRVMPLPMLFDVLAVQLNGPKAAGRHITLNLIFPDVSQQYVLTVENAVLNYHADRQAAAADATIRLTRPAFLEVLLGTATMEAKIASGEVMVEGKPETFGEWLSWLDTFDPWFNIVTP